MPFTVHFYVALFLLNSYTALSTWGNQANNNIVNKNNNSENSSNHNNEGLVEASSNSDVMDTDFVPFHSNNEFVYSRQAIKGQRGTASMVIASIKMTKELQQKKSAANEIGNSICIRLVHT